MLQNRYGDREFPVRVRWSKAQEVRRLVLRHDPGSAKWRGLASVAPGLALLLIVGFFGDRVTALLPAGLRDSTTPILVGLGLFVVVIAASILIGVRADASLPRREQAEYRRLTSGQDPTPRQQQLLALDAHSDFAFGGWNSSLDFAPADRMLPAIERRRVERLRDDPRRPRPRFSTMPVLSTAGLRADLDSKFQLAGPADVELFVADGLSDRSLSHRFHEVLHGPDGERMLARIGSLTGADQWDLRELDEPVGGLPPRLLRGADVQRVIGVVRMAFLAEHLDEAAAWRLIERAAAPASALFDSWDAYWANVRIGVAFLTDRLEAVQDFDRTLTDLRASGWPAAHVQFPSGGAVPAWLPRFLAPQPDRDPDGA